jgi:protein TonB
MTALQVQNHLQARSRQFLRRGLVLSCAIHLTLLFTFLSLTNRGEVVIRTYDRGFDLLPQTTILDPAPPAPPPGEPAAAVTKEKGIIDPVDRTLEQESQFDPSDFQTKVRASGGDDPGGIEPTGTPGTGSPSGDPPVYDIKQVEDLPEAVYLPTPRYPDYEREAGITGLVVLRVLVQADGTVSRVNVVSGLRGLGLSAQETLYRWRFKPARMNGKAVPVWVEIPVRFKL